MALLAGYERHWAVSSGTEYHLDGTAISSSMLRYYNRHGSLAYWHKYLSERTVELEEKSEALKLGSLFHALAEGQDIRRNLVTTPDSMPNGMVINRRMKAHREYLASWYEDQALAGKEIVQPETLDAVTHMAASLREHAVVRGLIGRMGYTERAVRWTDKGSGLELKAMADVWIPDGNILLDFKTTRHHTTQEFSRDAKSKGYHEQAALYCDGFEADQFIIITVRNSEPWECMAYRVPSHLLEAGRSANRDAIAGIKCCSLTGSWQSDGHGELMELDF